MKISMVIDVKAPLERTFTVFSDIPGAEDVLTGVTKLEILDGAARVGKGFRWRETRTMFGKDATEEMWMTDFAPPTRYVVTAESHGTRYVSTFDFTAIADGTRVAQLFEATPMSLGARLLAPLAFLFISSSKKAFLTDMNDLRRHAEHPAPAAP